jgi:hypothetical protein
MATYDDYQRETERLARQRRRDAEARAKCYDMHGGDHPNPLEAPMPTIIAQFGTWAVTPFGVECLVYPYEIQWDSITDERVDDDYWLSFLGKKDWVNLHDFAEALRHGRSIHRYLQGLDSDQDTRPSAPLAPQNV